MKPLRIKWQTHPNPDCQSLHCDVRLPYVTNNVSEHTDGTADAAEWLEYLSAIHGIDHVYCRDYELSVSKGSVFDWEEIKPAVEKALLAFCRATDLVRV